MRWTLDNYINIYIYECIHVYMSWIYFLIPSPYCDLVYDMDNSFWIWLFFYYFPPFVEPFSISQRSTAFVSHHLLHVPSLHTCIHFAHHPQQYLNLPLVTSVWQIFCFGSLFDNLFSCSWLYKTQIKPMNVFVSYPELTMTRSVWALCK